MSQNQTQILCYAYSATGALAVLVHPSLLVFLDFSIPGKSGVAASLFTWVFIASCFAGAAGVAMRRWWGFASLYLATAAASTGVAICMVPFVIQAFPPRSRLLPLLGLNAIYLGGLVALHLAVGRQSRAAA